jgi:hypothetical protein
MYIMDECKTSTLEGNMLKTLYSVYDRKSKIYAQPFTEVADGTAIRAMQDIIANNPNHPFARYPEDFELIRVGSFNEMDGSISEDPQGSVIEMKALGENK